MSRVHSSFMRYAIAGLLALAGALPAFAEASELPGVHNFFRATAGVFSGSQPEGEAAFAALAKLGVKTLISVDGAKPDVELAARYGLRYIHLPFGYDGIPTNRVLELARAATTVQGPVFVHCHHGKHRGPAAVSIICLADGGWTPAQAEEFLRKAGTSVDYPGLYRAAREFKAPTAEQLAAVSTNFPAVNQTDSLVDTMVAVDNIFENLKRVRDAGWKTPADHADLSPAHEAMQLLEQFLELSRTPETARRPEDFRIKLTAGVRATEQLHAALKAGDPADAASKRVTQSCVDCHKRYRNE
jgi:protein tyrosine phosphatase (PTP) superfamily phosphohydrolase (DUF442 family)